MRFEHPITIDQLVREYDAAGAKASEELNWYEERRWKWRIWSHFTRGTVFLGLIIGTVLPFTSIESPVVFGVTFATGTQLGLAYLVVTGLLYSLDQVFMISKTWVRYRDAQTKIESLLLECEYDWIRMQASIPDDDAAREKCDEALALFDKLVMDVRRVVEEETDVWNTQFEAARGILGKLLKQQTETVRQKVEEEKKASAEQRKAREAPRVGGVKVHIKNHTNLKGEMTLKVGNVAPKETTPKSVVVFPSVPLGQHMVTLDATNSTTDDEVKMEDLVQVVADKPAEVVFTVD